MNTHFVMKQAVLFLFVLFLCPCTHVYASNGSDTITEEQIREIVIDVIKKNPKLIYDVLNNYVRKEREKNEIASAFKHRISGIPINKYNPSKGPQDAPIIIIEFTDFQCPFCKRASRTIDELMGQYPGKIRLVFKNLPLTSIHKEALNAAKAAMAANKQGMFWPYHDMLFDNPTSLGESLYIRTARTLGLDMEKFKKDMKSKQIDKEVQADIKTAKKFGINVTPVFVINGVIVKGAKPLPFFKKIVDTLLKTEQEQIK